MRTTCGFVSAVLIVMSIWLMPPNDIVLSQYEFKVRVVMLGTPTILVLASIFLFFWSLGKEDRPW